MRKCSWCGGNISGVVGKDYEIYQHKGRLNFLHKRECEDAWLRAVGKKTTRKLGHFIRENYEGRYSGKKGRRNVKGW